MNVQCHSKIIHILHKVSMYCKIMPRKHIFLISCPCGMHSTRFMSKWLLWTSSKRLSGFYWFEVWQMLHWIDSLNASKQFTEKTNINYLLQIIISVSDNAHLFPKTTLIYCSFIKCRQFGFRTCPEFPMCVCERPTGGIFMAVPMN